MMKSDGELTIYYMSRLRVTARSTTDPDRNSSCPGFRYRHGESTNPLWMLTEYLLSGAGQTYHTEKVVDLVPWYFLSILTSATAYTVEINKSLGMVPRV